jgi:hypothetical protein
MNLNSVFRLLVVVKEIGGEGSCENICFIHFGFRNQSMRYGMGKSLGFGLGVDIFGSRLSFASTMWLASRYQLQTICLQNVTNRII